MAGQMDLLLSDIPADADGLPSQTLWIHNERFVRNIRGFLSAFPLTVPPGNDAQPHPDPTQKYGRITIPLLVQDATFSEDNSNWPAFRPLLELLDKLLLYYSDFLKKELKRIDPNPQGRTRTDYEAALEICKRALPADKRAIPLSIETRNVNCFSHVRISVCISPHDPVERLTPDTETKECGPYVLIVPWGKWAVNKDWTQGGKIVLPPNTIMPCLPSQYHLIRKERHIFNTPIEAGKERYQFEFFMPHIPEHDSEALEKASRYDFVQAKIHHALNTGKNQRGC
ncbi:hypothetical protein DSL72_002520 [Monilinia vaccinii-corymbosi]|uniref:Uncharacterized protein n=1 Tax=Monilinia vaccinii-corymbosi TaxID=61207 RepID=A0A8A3PCS6_9HELO|nr:hypothetical protein DSL72_002520 [Monilinia vaccinii-corymbosi]